jgi:hypothetical protein
MCHNGAEMKKKPATITFTFPNDFDHEFEISCHYNAINLNFSVYDALQKIRNVIKYTEISEKERKLLEELKEILSEYYTEG